MGLPSWLKAIGAIGSVVAAPFTAGTSLSWLPAAFGAASVAGGLLSNTKGARTRTTTPVLSPADQELQDLLMARTRERFATGGALPPGYENQGIGNINSTYDLIDQATRNKLTRRGLTGSPNEAAVLGRNELTRGGDIARFQNSLPLLERNLADEDFTRALSIMRPGVQTVNPGSAVGSAFSDSAEWLAYLYGSGALGGKSASGGAAGPPPPGGLGYG